jgi:hypothetical protein
MLLTTAVIFWELLTAGQRIDVAVCNPDGVTESVISNAKVETELVYRLMRVRIVWRACETLVTSVSEGRVPAFLIRLSNGKPPATVGPASLDVMGEAFVEGRYGGSTADVYFQAVRETAEEHYADPSAVLGFVLAHELGHLLLGPGHTPNGVMQAVWGRREIDALRQRRLRFTREGAARIRLVLGVRMAANAGMAAGTRVPNEAAPAFLPHPEPR